MATNYFKWFGEKIKTIGTTDGGHSLQMCLNDSAGTPVVLDKSGSFKVVTEFQNAVHDGESFSYSANQIGLADAGIVKFLGRAGAKQVHFDGFHIKASNAPFAIQFYEAPTVSNAGTLVPTRRRNRSNDNTSLLTVYSGPTASGGTLLDDDLIVELSQGNSINSGSGSIDDGWVLEANTDYMIVMTNLSGAAVNWSAKFSWHEATYNV